MRSRSMTDGENHRDLLTRFSTALAMTQAAYLKARRRRTDGTLIKEGDPDLRECRERLTRKDRRRSLLGLRRELAGQDLPIGPQGAQIAAVDLHLDSTGVAGPDAQRVVPLERSRETGLGDSLVGDSAVGRDLQPRGGAAYAHRRSDAVLGGLLRPGGVFAIRVRARWFEPRRRQRIGRLCEQAAVAIVKGTVDDQEERQRHEHELRRVRQLV